MDSRCLAQDMAPCEPLMDRHVMAAASGAWGCVRAAHSCIAVLGALTSAPWCLKEGVFPVIMSTVYLPQGRKWHGPGWVPVGSGGLNDLDAALLSLLQANTGFLRTYLRWRPITYSVGKEEEGQNWLPTSAASKQSGSEHIGHSRSWCPSCVRG